MRTEHDENDAVYYELARHVNARWVGSQLLFGFGSIHQRISKPSLGRVIVEVAEYLCDPRTKGEVQSFIAARVPVQADRARVSSELFQWLLQGRFIVESGGYDPDDRYSRHWLFYHMSGGTPAHIQQRLKSSRVVVLGCGGIGNLVAVSLATAGVGELVLVDHDTVELSNLTRQHLFTERDVGRKKVEVLRERLSERNSSVQVRVIDNATGPDALAEISTSSLAILSADRPRSLIHVVNDWSLATGTPFVSVGYVQDIAVWGPFFAPGRTPCTQCVRSIESITRDDQDEALRRINSRYQTPSMGPVNMLAASCAAMDAIKFLGGFGQVQAWGRKVTLWTHDLRLELEPVVATEPCHRCKVVPPGTGSSTGEASRHA